VTLGSREVAVDRLRGIVVVLMVVDHAGAFFDAGHLQTDSLALYRHGMELPADRFLLRFLTHLCAPTFVFLAGTAIYLSVARRHPSRAVDRSIDRHLFTRGLVLIGLELSVITLSWASASGFHYNPVLQVIWAIGASFLLMIPLRRVPIRWLAAGAFTYLILQEWIVFSVCGWDGDFRSMDPLGAIFFGIGSYQIGETYCSIAYPVLPWLAMMVFGWCFGRVLVDARETQSQPALPLGVIGVALLILFVVVRGLNGFGNMGLLRADASLVEWLHVSKYPPSLSFVLVTLGIMALVLASLFLARARPRTESRPSRDPLVVFGETPLFFYVLHIPLLGLSRRALGDAAAAAGLGTVFVATVVVLTVLYPACIGYRRLKASRKHAWTRFV
jgi:uncharacterized membrane protein